MTVTDERPKFFYHPIKVIFLDDNPAFLDAINLEFSSKFNLLTHTDPNIIYQAIENNLNLGETIFKLRRNVQPDIVAEGNRYLINNLLNVIYETRRFNQAPILIIDYKMPNINGIEFCEKIKENKSFKVMLTAEVDKDIVIQAFNAGLIDKFILKTSDNLFFEIECAIHELTQRYFKELSNRFIEDKIVSIESLFKNKLYQQLFYKVLLESNAVEYYLVDNFGTMLFLDKDATPTWLVVRHIKDLAEQLDLLSGYDLPEKVIDSISKKQKILFLLSEDEYRKPASDWLEYFFFESKKLDNNYSYCIINNYLTEAVEWRRVISYKQYLAKKNYENFILS